MLSLFCLRVSPQQKNMEEKNRKHLTKSLPGLSPQGLSHPPHPSPRRLSEVYKQIVQDTEPQVDNYVHNVPNSRYRNILPLQGSVVEITTNFCSTSTPMNADFVNLPGVSGNRMFIFSQGPTTHGASDFWKMILQHNVSTICKLTPLVENFTDKCAKYWPEKLESERFDDLVVTNIREEQVIPGVLILRFFKIIQFEFNFDSDVGSSDDLPEEHQEILRERYIMQVDYVGWPDHSAPKVKDIEMITLVLDLVEDPMKWVVSQEKLNDSQLTSCINALDRDISSSTVVHCSAGIGRTGTFGLLFAARNLIRKGIKPDPAEILTNIRGQRAGAVNRSKQFEFACRLIKYWWNLVGKRVFLCASTD